MLPFLVSHPLRGPMRRYSTTAFAPLFHSSIWPGSGCKRGSSHASTAADLRVWTALYCRCISSGTPTKTTSDVPAAAAGVRGEPCSPSLTAATSASAGGATGGLSASAAAALGVIKSAYEQMCRKSVALNVHVHHQAIKTQIPKPKAAATTAARLAAAASREAAAPVAPAAPAGAGTATGGAKSVKQLTRAERRSFEGNLRRFQLMGDKSEFHHVDRNRNKRIFEPYHMFSLSITTSKNNVHCVVRNSSSNKRTVFTSFAGNVGIRKSAQQSSACSLRIGENIARKLRRLGVDGVSVEFRRISRVSAVLKALSNHKIHVYSITHKPRLPTCGLNARKPRKRRRV